jgi:hypothetical protein
MSGPERRSPQIANGTTGRVLVVLVEMSFEVWKFEFVQATAFWMSDIVTFASAFA